MYSLVALQAFQEGTDKWQPIYREVRHQGTFFSGGTIKPPVSLNID
jgi:hypothetical protein